MDNNQIATNYSQYVSGKVSKIRWTPITDNIDNRQRSIDCKPETFVTGTWDQSINEIRLWNNRQVHGDDDQFELLARLPVQYDVSDMLFVSANKLVIAGNNGDVSMIAVDADINRISIKHVCNRVHSMVAATCLAAFDDIIISGGEDGRIVQFDANQFTPTGDIGGRGLSSVRALARCGRNQLISTHLTGQLMLWDLRQSDRETPIECLGGTCNADAVTSVTTHPAEPNLVAFGTQTGLVGFCDIRRADQPLPELLTVASGPIWEIKFHPFYANNCFTCAEDGSLLHWDASALKQNTFGNRDQSKLNVWLLGAASLSDYVRLSNLLPDRSLLSLNSFDIAGNSVIVGSDSETVMFIDDIYMR